MYFSCFYQLMSKKHTEVSSLETEKPILASEILKERKKGFMKFLFMRELSISRR